MTGPCRCYFGYQPFVRVYTSIVERCLQPFGSWSSYKVGVVVCIVAGFIAVSVFSLKAGRLGLSACACSPFVLSNVCWSSSLAPLPLIVPLPPSSASSFAAHFTSLTGTVYFHPNCILRAVCRRFCVFACACR